MENAFDFDPPDPRMVDMSPKGTMTTTAMRTAQHMRIALCTLCTYY